MSPMNPMPPMRADSADAGSAVASAANQALAPLPRLDSQQLFEGQRELIIQHQGEEYRLRITRHEKLILTK